MGKKLDRLLGRTSRASKLKTLLSLAVGRMAVLKNQRRVRCSQARGDVAELLKLGHQERALQRVEYVIREQNMLDAFATIEGYCELLIERTVLIKCQDDCPGELKEAISSLTFASSRCGESPELHDIRGLFANRYGKEFTAAAVDLINNCGVNPKLIQRMSTKPPSLENRLAVLKEIAAEQKITLTIQEPSITNKEDGSNSVHHQSHKLNPTTSGATPQGTNNRARAFHEEATDHQRWSESDLLKEQMSESIKGRKYIDVASAAQAAFESAAYAAAAARAAVELSRSESQGRGSGDDTINSSSPRWSSTGSCHGLLHVGGDFENIHTVEIGHLVHQKDKEEAIQTKQVNQLEDWDKYDKMLGRSGNARSSHEMEKKQNQGKLIIFDESDEDSEEEQDTLVPKSNTFGLGSETKYDSMVSGSEENHMINSQYDSSESGPHFLPQTKTTEDDNQACSNYLRLKVEGGHFGSEESLKKVRQLNIGKRPMSVRTKRAFT